MDCPLGKKSKNAQDQKLFHFKLKATRGVLWLSKTIRIKLQTLLGAIYSSPGYCRYTNTHTHGKSKAVVSLPVNRFKDTVNTQHIQQAEQAGLGAGLREHTHTQKFKDNRHKNTQTHDYEICWIFLFQFY